MKLLLLALLTIFSLSSARADFIFDSEEAKGRQEIQAFADVRGVSIMFWNVAWGNFNQTGNLDANLTALMDSPGRPDMLILGEYKPSVLAKATREHLREIYPYRHFQINNQKSKVGIAVFSVGDFSASGARTMDWVPLAQSQEKQEDFRALWAASAPDDIIHWERTYFTVFWKIRGRSLSIVPTHLCSPWEAYAKRYGGAAAAQSLYFGSTLNPLYNQMMNYRGLLESDFGKDLHKGGPLLLMGDFNIQGRTYGLLPSMFESLKRGLNDLFNEFSAATYPTSSSGEVLRGAFGEERSIKIDHAFGNDLIESIDNTILYLRGSDHYPIYVVVDVKSTRSLLERLF